MPSASVYFEEAMHMTDYSQNSKLSALAAHGEVAVNRTMSLVKLGVLAVSVAAAIPTARNLYYSWTTGVPFNQVEHRLTQAELLEKNFDCKIDYRALSAATGAKVDVGSCAKTGDISIKISGPNGQVNYEWIAFEKLPKPAATQAASSMLDIFITAAIAEELAKPKAAPATAAPIVVAAAETEVLCQAKAKDMITRVVKEAGKCFKETVSLFKGTVEKREEVACDKACPAP
jgi:hypothetical protein